MISQNEYNDLILSILDPILGEPVIEGLSFLAQLHNDVKNIILNQGLINFVQATPEELGEVEEVKPKKATKKKGAKK